MNLLTVFGFCGLFAVAFSDCTEHTCIRTQTCCPGFEPGEFGCCPHLNAVCCPDKEHCCPDNTICDSSTGGCIPEMSELRRDFHKRHSLLEDDMEDSPVLNQANLKRCDKDVYCPVMATCCSRPSGPSYCCPHPDATCCPNGRQCCPSGFKCDSSSLLCIREDGE